LRKLPKALIYEDKSFVDIAKKAGLQTAGRAWAHEFRDMIGVPMSAQEEQGLAQDMMLVDKHLGNTKDLRQYLYKSFHGGFENKEDFKQVARGMVNAAVGAFPMGGAVEEVLLTQLGTKLVPHAVMRGIVQAEAHSIASMVAWNVGTAAVNEENPLQAAKEGAIMGALFPVGAKAAEFALGGAARGVGLVGKTVVKPTMNMLDRALMRTSIYRSVRRLWDMGGPFTGYAGRAGESLLRAAGLGPIADKLMQTRGAAHAMAGEWVGRAAKEYYGLGFGKSASAARSMLGAMLHVDPEERVALATQAGYSFEKAQDLVARATRLEGLLHEVAQAAVAAGITQVDAKTGLLRFFIPRNDWGLPHVYVDTEQFITPGKVRDQAIKTLVEDNGMSRARAEKVLQSIHNRTQAALEDGDLAASKGIGYVDLMGRRYNLPGYVTDPKAILPDYFANMASRIQNHTAFGRQTLVERMVGEKVQIAEAAAGHQLAPEEVAALAKPIEDKVYGEMEKGIKNQFPLAFEGTENMTDGMRKDLAQNIIKNQLGGFDKGPGWVQTLSKAAAYEAVMKLGLGQFTQLTQIAQAVGHTGFHGAARDFFRLLARDPEAHDIALRSGAILDSFVRASLGDIMQGGARISEKALRYTGFTGMDTFARAFGAVRGYTESQHLSGKLAELISDLPNTRGLEKKMTERAIEKLSAKFTEMGIDTGPLIARGGVLTEKEALQAALKVSTDINFWSDSLSLPEFYKSPSGKVFAQFKSFSFQQTKYIQQHVLKPAFERGDIGPILRTLPIQLVTGELIADLKSTFRMKPRRTAGLSRLMTDLTQGGSFGLLADAINATNFKNGIASYEVGPLSSDLITTSEGLLQPKGRVRTIGKEIFLVTPAFASRIPVVGPALGAAGSVLLPGLSNLVFPPRKP
jgi:hypothetical protein